jgi:LacI family transcriptional regulator
MPEKTTINTIAEQSGVSIATVSLVLNGKPGVSQQTRARVLEVATDLGYAVKSSQSASLSLNSVGMITKSETNLPAQENPFYSKVMGGIEETCRRNDISLLFSSLPVDQNNHPIEVPPIFFSEAVDGFLMVGAFVDATITKSASGKKIPPIVLVDGYSDTDSYDAVVSDNFQAAYDAVEFLIEKGHRQIGLIGSEEDSYPSLKQRRNGYLRALKENGITTSYIADFKINYEKGFTQTKDLLSRHPEITALFAVNDEIAVNAMYAAQELGLRVPQDISIVGYDDTYLAVNVSPKLTTMHVDTAAMGRAAVHLLQLRIENPATARMTLTIHPVLVERASVAEPRRS